jgi:hypothetical protein
MFCIHEEDHFSKIHGVAAAAASSSCADPTASALATVGSGYVQNMERDFQRWMSESLEFKRLIREVPITIQEDDQEIPAKWPVVPPVEMASKLWENDFFETSVLGPDGREGIKVFWESVKNEEWFLSHPGLDRENLDLTVQIWDGIFMNAIAHTKLEAYALWM